MHNSIQLLDDERDILMLATKETQSALRQYPINIQRQPWGNYKVTLINLPLPGHTRLFWKYLFMSLNCKVKSVFYRHSLTVHTLELPDDQGQPLKPPGSPEFLTWVQNVTILMSRRESQGRHFTAYGPHVEHCPLAKL